MRKVLYILGQLSDLDVEWLAREGHKKHAALGEVLIREGKPVEYIVIVLDGVLEVTSSMYPGQPVAFLKSGDIVGEMSFVDASPPSATVTVKENATLLFISRSSIAKKLDHDKEFGAHFYKAVSMFLSDRLRHTMSLKGETQRTSPQGALDKDELDPDVLDSVSLAGARFDRLLKKLKKD